MAQAVFKSWFVDFEPWNGIMPKEWTAGIINDNCISVQNGGTPRRNVSRFWDNGDIPWLISGEVRQPIITVPENSITADGLAESSAKWVPALSTVVALYGATAGQVSMISSRLTTNQAICALIAKKNFEYFNYLWMCNAVTDLENKAVGSAQQNISKAVVESTRCIAPQESAIKEFNVLVKPLFDKWILNLSESKNLAILRNFLLPRLMSGELKILP